jgi:hypothetical protein
MPTEIEESNEQGQSWELCLSPRVVDSYSDADLRYVIAHGLGHVATAPRLTYEELHRREQLSPSARAEEERQAKRQADIFALRWGFLPDRLPRSCTSSLRIIEMDLSGNTHMA